MIRTILTIAVFAGYWYGCVTAFLILMGSKEDMGRIEDRSGLLLGSALILSYLFFHHFLRDQLSGVVAVYLRHTLSIDMQVAGQDVHTTLKYRDYGPYPVTRPSWFGRTSKSVACPECGETVKLKLCGWWLAFLWRGLFSIVPVIGLVVLWFGPTEPGLAFKIVMWVTVLTLFFGSLPGMMTALEPATEFAVSGSTDNHSAYTPTDDD